MRRACSINDVIVLPGLLCCALACGCESRSTPTGPASPAAPAPAVPMPAADVRSDAAAPQDESAPKVEVKILDYDGIQRLVAGHRGKVVVMDAWSTSCAPCLREFPRLVELHNRYGRDDVACVSLSFDFEGLSQPEDELPRVLKYLKSKKATFDNILSSNSSDDLYRRFGLASIPAVFVYDRKGQLRKRFDNEEAGASGGPFTYEQVAALVAELVQEPR